MAERIRFHLDENVDLRVADALRRLGLGVTTTYYAGLQNQNDLAQFTYIRREGRVLITHDADMLRLAQTFPDHPGVCFCALGSRSLGQIIRSVALVAEVLTHAEMQGARRIPVAGCLHHG